jgi:stearoyl-CoA desaturase (delta-9 desaturase)
LITSPVELPVQVPEEAAGRVPLPKVSLPLPETVWPLQIEWGYTASVTAFTLSLSSLCRGISVDGVRLALAGLPLYGTLGINLCYHRLLTHRGLTCPKWLEHSLAMLGVCCLQDTPARWVAIHRLHHQHSDRQSDPHSPLVNFLWAHVGWVLVRNREHSRLPFFEQYARDVLRDPFYLRLERNIAWFWV